jgi:hypothetical protein
MNTTTRPNDDIVLAAARTPLAPQAAHRWAWRIWLFLPVVPCLLTVFVILRVATTAAPGDEALARAWSLVTLACLAAAVPAAFFWRSNLFRTYGAGSTVPPRTYLLGMAAIWGALATVELVASLACLISGRLMPNLGIGLITLMFYCTLWPTGDVMVRPVGGTDDPEVYEEPR